MNEELNTAMTALQKAHQQFQSGEISSVGHSKARESALAAALNAIARENQVALTQPLMFDSRGEFLIVCERRPRDEKPPQYGPVLSALLTKHGARCGVQPGAHIASEASWCWLNHFSAERLVKDYAGQATDEDVEAAEAAPGESPPGALA